jgi:hypothetical protein
MWRANGKTTTLLLLLDSLCPKIEEMNEMLQLEIKHYTGKLLPHLDLWGVSLEETSRSTHYRKTGKDPHQYRIGTWNVRTLNQGGKLENLKEEMEKNGVSVMGVVK